MKQCPFCGAQLEDSFTFCAICGNAQPGAQQPAPQQPVPQQPVPQQPAPAPKEPGKLHFFIDDMMKKYILPATVGVLGVQTLVNITDNIRPMGRISLVFTLLVIFSFLLNIGGAVLAFFGWTGWKKEKTLGPILSIVAFGLATFGNLLYLIAEIIGFAGYRYMVHFPTLALLVFMVSTAALVFAIIAFVGLKSKFHK